MKNLKAGALGLMVLLGLSGTALVLLYGITKCSKTVSIECLLEDAKAIEAIYDLTFAIVAGLALLMGAWRLWLADKRDSREKEDRKEQSERHERDESDHWRERFSAAVVQVLEDTGEGSLLVARRVHALREMAWIAEKFPTKFMSQAKDVVERFETRAGAERELEDRTGGLLQFEAEALQPVSIEDQLNRIAKTGGAIYDLYKEAADLKEKWGEKPADGGSDHGP